MSEIGRLNHPKPIKSYIKRPRFRFTYKNVDQGIKIYKMGSTDQNFDQLIKSQIRWSKDGDLDQEMKKSIDQRLEQIKFRSTDYDIDQNTS